MIHFWSMVASDRKVIVVRTWRVEEENVWHCGVLFFFVPLPTRQGN
jgi:hypothetical protein